MSALGTSQDPVSVRCHRLRLREVSRIYSAGRRRTCGDPIGTAVRLGRTSTGAACVSQVETCGSVWSCPVCSSRISAGRSDEVRSLVDFARDNGLHVSFITLTISHTRVDPLRHLWDDLLDVWGRMRSSRAWRDLTARLGVVGFVRASEVTWGERTGWHPHLHLLLVSEVSIGTLCEGLPVPGIRGARYSARHGLTCAHYIGALWSYWAGKVGRRVDPRVGVDVRPVYLDVDDVDAMIGSYVGKGAGVGREMTGGAYAKRGRVGVRMTPGQILEALAERDHPAYLERIWYEWDEAAAGRRQLVWSVGLRDLVGLGDVSDEDLADGVGEDEREVIGFISACDYRDLRRSGRLPDLYDVIDTTLLFSTSGSIFVGNRWVRLYASPDDIPTCPAEKSAAACAMCL